MMAVSTALGIVAGIAGLYLSYYAGTRRGRLDRGDRRRLSPSARRYRNLADDSPADPLVEAGAGERPMSAPARDWPERAQQALAEAGLRSGAGPGSGGRAARRGNCALTALEIDRRLPRIGRASVYRALEQLEQLGLVQRVDLGRDAAGYERVDPGGHHHHHIVCERCGRVIPFEDPPLERAITALGKRSDFNVASHEVTLRGECAECAKD